LRQTVWINGGIAPHIESEALAAIAEYHEHGSFSFPGILNLPPQLTARSFLLGSEPLVSFIDPLIPPTCLILNKCEDPLDWDGDDLWVAPMKVPEGERLKATAPTVRGAPNPNPGQHTAQMTGVLGLEDGEDGTRRPPQVLYTYVFFFYHRSFMHCSRPFHHFIFHPS
jgi:hypothetical protein